MTYSRIVRSRSLRMTKSRTRARRASAASGNGDGVWPTMCVTPRDLRSISAMLSCRWPMSSSSSAFSSLLELLLSSLSSWSMLSRNPAPCDVSFWSCSSTRPSIDSVQPVLSCSPFCLVLPAACVDGSVDGSSSSSFGPSSSSASGSARSGSGRSARSGRIAFTPSVSLSTACCSSIANDSTTCCSSISDGWVAPDASTGAVDSISTAFSDSSTNCSSISYGRASSAWDCASCSGLSCTSCSCETIPPPPSPSSGGVPCSETYHAGAGASSCSCWTSASCPSHFCSSGTSSGMARIASSSTSRRTR